MVSRAASLAVGELAGPTLLHHAIFQGKTVLPTDACAQGHLLAFRELLDHARQAGRVVVLDEQSSGRDFAVLLDVAPVHRSHES